MIQIGNLDLGHLADILSYLSNLIPKSFRYLLLDHLGQPHVLLLTFHLVNFLGWVGRGDPCDYCVSPSPKNWVFGFFRLGLDLRS